MHYSTINLLWKSHRTNVDWESPSCKWASNIHQPDTGPAYQYNKGQLPCAREVLNGREMHQYFDNLQFLRLVIIPSLDRWHFGCDYFHLL